MIRGIVDYRLGNRIFLRPAECVCDEILCNGYDLLNGPQFTTNKKHVTCRHCLKKLLKK